MGSRFMAALKLCIGGVAIVLAMTEAAWATPFLSVDVENNNSPVTAAGFTSWPTLGTSGTITSSSKVFSGLSLSDVDDGTFTATIAAWTTASGSIVAANALGSRSRSAPTYVGVTNANMLRDFVFQAATNSQGRTYMSLDFTGLTANEAYNITVFSLENSGSSNQSTNWTSIAPPSASLGYSGTSTFVAHKNLTGSPNGTTIPTNNNGGAAPTNVNNPSGGATFTLTTNGSGNTSLYAWGGNGVDGNTTQTNAYFNGFTIESIPVPEPASGVLLALGGSLVLLRRRWR